MEREWGRDEEGGGGRDRKVHAVNNMSELSCEYLNMLCTANIFTKEMRDKVHFDTVVVNNNITLQLNLSMWLLSDVLTR